MQTLRRVLIVILGMCLLAGAFVWLGGCSKSDSSSVDRASQQAAKEIDQLIKDANKSRP